MRIVVLSMLAAICSETSHQDADDHDKEQVCRDTAAATCERYLACLSDEELAEAGYTSDLEECIAQESARCADISPTYYCTSTQTYSPESAELCLEQTRRLTCPGVGPGLYDMRNACRATCIDGPGDDGESDF
jgi:hypothetical protein